MISLNWCFVRGHSQVINIGALATPLLLYSEPLGVQSHAMGDLRSLEVGGLEFQVSIESAISIL